MAVLNITVPDADLAAVNAAWTARGYVGLTARLQEFADDEVHATRLQARQAVVAAEQAKGIGADSAVIASALKAEYDLRVARDAVTKAAAAALEDVLKGA